MKFILGQKLDMTRLWIGDNCRAVTRVQVGPCVVLAIKNLQRDGYEAVQLGYGKKSAKNISKPQRGHFKEAGNFKYLKEIRTDKKGKWGEMTELNIGDVIDVKSFQVGDKLTLTADVKGRGFQGVVKRHGFHGHNATHGTKDAERMPGSIGAGGVQHVFKGMRMAGRMGGNQVTFKGAEILKIDEEKNIIYLATGIPGGRGTLVKFYGAGELKLNKPAETTAPESVEPTKEEPAEEEPVKEEPIVEVAEQATEEKIES